ncbi:PDR/VanB family oxidoreductase [Williamsia sp.]|uniref:PDR/VanB family oxidoreductase n=1 Tax=Williamsia sp. TaxID=1872085 RepID=UPI002F94D512
MTNTAELVVKATIWEADAVLGVVLADLDGKPLPQWQPGCWIGLHVNGIQRQYSLCGDVDDPYTYRIAVRLADASRGGSSFIHDHLRPGHVITVGLPFNSFPMVPAPEYLFVAGGVGITALLPMIAAADRARVSWELLYCGRTRWTMPFLDILGTYAGKVSVFTSEDGNRPDLTSAVSALPTTTRVYCCGPESMLSEIETAARIAGVAVSAERFVPADVDHGDDLPFTVHCTESALDVTVPAGRSMAAALNDAGLAVDTACSEGICGTCKLAVTGGTPDHRDQVLTAQERSAGAAIMACVSRSLGPSLSVAL